MRSRWLKTTVPLIVVLGLLLTSCGSGTPTAAPTATSVPPTATPRPTAAATAAPSATAVSVPPTATPVPTRAPTATATPQPVASGSLVVAAADISGAGGFALNPAIHPLGGRMVMFLEGLYDYNMSTTVGGQFDASTGFVQSYAANADSTMWTFKVRSDLVFHNGDKASSADMKYMIDLALEPKPIYNSAGDLSGQIASVETPDAATVVITLKKTNIFFPQVSQSRDRNSTNSSLFIVNRKYTTAVGQEAANKSPIGSGPYKFKSAAIGDQVVEEAVDYAHFRYGVPRTKTLTFRQVPEEATRKALLKTGDVDATAVSLSEVPDLKKTTLRVVPRDGSIIVHSWFAAYPDVIPGFGPNPLADKRVRQALYHYGIDRQSIVDNFLYGIGTPSLDNPIRPTDLYAYKKQPVPAYDPVRAKTLLTQAGYANGFELDYYVLTLNPSLPQVIDIAEAVAVWWEKLGIKVNRKPYTGAVLSAFWQAHYQKGDWGKPTAGSPTAGNAYQAVSTSLAVLNHDPASFASISRDPEGLRLGRAVASATTVAEYKTASEAYQAYTIENALTWMPYVFTSDVWATSSKVTSKWQLGNDPGWRLADAAALR